jgi:S1-C subfamily serine protease
MKLFPKSASRRVCLALQTICLALAATSALAAEPPTSAATIQFAKMRSKLTIGEPFGKYARSSMFGCGQGTDLKATDTTERMFSLEAQHAFKREAETAGFQVFRQEVSAFDTAPSGDPDYRLGGTLQETNFNLCVSGNQEKGSIHVEVKWELFSVKQQRVVLTRTTKGDFSATELMDGQGVEFESKGFAAAMRSLFAMPEFQALMAGQAPEAAPPAFAPLRLISAPQLSGDTQRNSAALLSAVVVIFTGQGSGSGFYLADGHVLTNRHVVGTSKYVKVKLSNGKELVGEVIRDDPARDVALLKTESVGFSPLRIKQSEPKVGSVVYAIGSPLGQELAGTLTKGVISGSRTTGGASYLQSDVAVNPGNSGGPLLDDTANVVGITAQKIAGAEGLAFFIPIKDPMDKLNLKFDDAAAP